MNTPRLTTPRLTTALTVGALGITLVGCGYSQSDPEKAVEAMTDALVDGDVAKVCDWTLGSDGKPVSGDERDLCLESATISDAESEEAKDGYDRMFAQGADVTQDGDTATLVYQVNDDDTWTVEMKEIDGRWYFVSSDS